MPQSQDKKEFHVIKGGKESESSEIRAYTCDDLAEFFGVGKRTVQTRFGRVLEAYPWLEISTLRTGESKHTRYTPLALELLQELQNRPDTMSENQWIEQVRSDNSDRYQRWLNSQNPEPEAGTQTEFQSQPTVNQSGSLALPPSADWLSDSPLDDVDTEIMTLQTRSLGRSALREGLSSRISVLALKGYKRGQVEFLEQEDELARIYEEEAQAEIERIERQQQEEAVRRKARQDVQQVYSSASQMGKHPSESTSQSS